MDAIEFPFIILFWVNHAFKWNEVSSFGSLQCFRPVSDPDYGMPLNGMIFFIVLLCVCDVDLRLVSADTAQLSLIHPHWRGFCCARYPLKCWSSVLNTRHLYKIFRLEPAQSLSPDGIRYKLLSKQISYTCPTETTNVFLWRRFFFLCFNSTILFKYCYYSVLLYHIQFI